MELSADTLRATSWEVWCSWRVFVVQSVSVVFVTAHVMSDWGRLGLLWQRGRTGSWCAHVTRCLKMLHMSPMLALLMTSLEVISEAIGTFVPGLV